MRRALRAIPHSGVLVGAAVLAGLGAAVLRRYAPLGLRVGISFFEIYGAELFDLLRARQKLVVRGPKRSLSRAVPCRGGAGGRAGWPHE